MNIKDYQGLNALKVLKTENERQVYQANWDQLNMNYDGHVEWQRLKYQILYCEETKEYLYADPEPVKYVPGTRPTLEKEVAEAVKGCTTDRERVLRLMEFCRDLYLNRGKGPIWSQQRPGRASANYDFYGGSEEVLIEKGENLCECMGRLMVALCEILGLPGRIIMHIVPGHITCEIWVEGRWAYIDPRCGMFYVDENNQFLSMRELLEHREYILNQPDWVKAYISDKQWTYEEREKANYEKNLSPKAMHAYGPYSLMDAPMYTFGVKAKEGADWDGPGWEGWKELHARYVKYVNLILEG